jgi:hypothetical protein
MTLNRYRKKSWRVLLFALLASFAFAGASGGNSLWAQEISQGTISANNISNAQDQEIQKFVSAWADKLGTGDPEAVRDARTKLMDPLQRGGTPAFNVTYSKDLSALIRNMVTADKPILVRLNAMIVASRLVDPGVVPLIQTAVVDDSPAIRFWGAKTASEYATNVKEIPFADQTVILDSLSGALAREQYSEPLQQMIIAMCKLTIPQATDRVLIGLNNRVTACATNPNTSRSADYQGMRLIFTRLVQQVGSGIPVDPKTVVALVKVAYRNALLSAAVLDANNVNEQYVRDYTEMLTLSDTVMKWGYTDLNPSGTPPPSFKDVIPLSQWPKIRLGLLEWEKILQQPPFNIPLQDLKVQLPQ